ncbi:Circadian clock protein KaiB (plasmid) [Aquisphaera giovannonii]|uniref:Circadian clock protein KaiB n=2 Tax=Aquisphaera giovannonii TaxID=406548 RepID=A0A5B9WHK9_9BACT|nr:Circadian clock protein KaiB [Aquisphaera giovannonii]
MGEYTFTLYVAGDGELATRALANFDRLVRSRLPGRCTLTIVDVLRDPAAARRDRVVATPMLVRERPGPVIKILGDLSQDAKALNQLGLDGPAATPAGRAGSQGEDEV